MLGVSHAVEVLVLGLLVVVYKIPHSSCIFNTAVVLACLCHIYSWFFPMSWILESFGLAFVFLDFELRSQN